MKSIASPLNLQHDGLDRLGVWASAACAVHCMVAPLIFLALPSLAPIWTHPASHALVAVLVLPLAGTVLAKGYRQHRRRWVAAAALFGMVFILVGSALPYFESAAPTTASAVEACASCCPQVVEEASGARSIVLPPAAITTMIGSLLLIAAHIGNLIACRCCRS